MTIELCIVIGLVGAGIIWDQIHRWRIKYDKHHPLYKGDDAGDRPAR